MAWFSPRPVLIPDILSWNQEFLDQKPAVIIDDDVISWSEFGSGTALIAELPRNPNGKILKRELREQYADVPG